MQVPDLIALTRSMLGEGGPPSSDFDLNPDFKPLADRKLRSAGVLAPITLRDGVAELILTKRSSALKHHPGQIAFPGGKQDDSDADVIGTALREAHEEIGLPPECVNVLGTLPIHETVTGFKVTPVVGLVHGHFEIKPEPGEVEEVFYVPLSYVLDKRNFTIESRRWRGLMRSYFTVPYGPYYIWGATARMLWAWTEKLN